MTQEQFRAIVLLLIWVVGLLTMVRGILA
jgi:hypothetical protein